MFYDIQYNHNKKVNYVTNGEGGDGHDWGSSNFKCFLFFNPSLKGLAQTRWILPSGGFRIKVVAYQKGSIKFITRKKSLF